MTVNISVQERDSTNLVSGGEFNTLVWNYISLVPRLLVGGERAWYLLFAHARNYPSLNTCLAKSGRGTRILIHVIDSVTYKFIKYTCTVECNEERNNHTTA